MEDFTALQRTMEAALKRELSNEAGEEDVKEILQEIKQLDIDNVLRWSIQDGASKTFKAAVKNTTESITVLRTAVNNLGRPLTAEETYIIQETLSVLHQLLCFYVAGTKFEEFSGEGYAIN